MLALCVCAAKREPYFSRRWYIYDIKNKKPNEHSEQTEKEIVYYI